MNLTEEFLQLLTPQTLHMIWLDIGTPPAKERRTWFGVDAFNLEVAEQKEAVDTFLEFAKTHLTSDEKYTVFKGAKQ